MIVCQGSVEGTPVAPEIVFVHEQSEPPHEPLPTRSSASSFELFRQFFLLVCHFLLVLHHFCPEFAVVLEGGSEVAVNLRLEHQPEEGAQRAEGSEPANHATGVIQGVPAVPIKHDQGEQEELKIEEDAVQVNLSQEQVDPLVTQFDHGQFADAFGFERNERYDDDQRQDVQNCHYVEVVRKGCSIVSQGQTLRWVDTELFVGAFKGNVVPGGVHQTLQSEERQFDGAFEVEQRKVDELAEHGHLQSHDFFGEDADEEGEERHQSDGQGQFVEQVG